ncbi:MAG: hypothetical protein M3P27_13340 [Acidobacteriota bacterium]|nr:hypothetical protein [Acidobacteriota bacterium]
MKRSLALLLFIALLAVTAFAADDLAVPAGTGIKMKLETAISTSTTKVGDAFAGRVVEPVMLDGKEVVPVGATIQGHVSRITEPRRLKGVPTIGINPDLLIMPTGEKYTLNAAVVDTAKDTHTRVDDEGEIKGSGHDKRDLLVAGVGAGAGAGVGAAVGGGKGALIGAVIGGAAAAGHWLWRKHSAELRPGTVITMELSRPMQFNTGASGK